MLFPVIAAVLVIILRLVIYYTNFEADWLTAANIFLHLLIVLICVIYAIWPRPGINAFLSDVKNGVKLAGVYAVLIAAFVFIYYSYIDSDFFPNMTEKIAQGTIAETPDKDPEEIETGVKSFFTPFNYTTITLIGYFCAGVFYSLLFAALKRVVLRPKGLKHNSEFR